MRTLKPLLASLLSLLVTAQSVQAVPFANSSAGPFNLSLASRLGFLSDSYARPGQTTPDFILIQDVSVTAPSNLPYPEFSRNSKSKICCPRVLESKARRGRWISPRCSVLPTGPA